MHPGLQILGGGAFFQLEAMGFEHIAQLGEHLFGLGRRTLRLCRRFAFDDVTAALAAYVHVIPLLQLFDELGKAVCAVSFFREGRVELQHGGLQKPELRLDAAPVEHLQGSLD